MKKLLIFAVLVVSVVFLLYSNKPEVGPDNTAKTIQKAQNVAGSESPQEDYIFVPYWTINSGLEAAPHEKLIYFGISAAKDGIDKNDSGYKNLSKFLDESQGKDTYLTVRMLDSDLNLDILENGALQKKIISESVDIAKSNKFKGVILDFEIQGIPFDSFVKSITSLNNNFASEVHRNNMTFGTLLYGDAYFRARPYDVGKISKKADRVYVMAYDFSKARGNPGPNFPFVGKETYGYDFKTMVADYGNDVPVNKLTVVFGMFGYDWRVDDKGRGVELAVSQSTLGFEKYMTNCVDSDSCKVIVDPISNETKISYSEDYNNHIIWFETNNSMQKKVDYLDSKGIHSVGFWAYSFF